AEQLATIPVAYRIVGGHEVRSAARLVGQRLLAATGAPPQTTVPQETTVPPETTVRPDPAGGGGRAHRRGGGGSAGSLRSRAAVARGWGAAASTATASPAAGSAPWSAPAPCRSRPACAGCRRRGRTAWT